VNSNYTQIDHILKKFNHDEKSLIHILQHIQDEVEGQYISEEIADYVAHKLGINKNRIYEVLTFFAALNETKKGKYLIQLCDSSVCRIKDSNSIQNALENILNIKIGETTEDNMFTLEYTACFGACDISPAIRINKKVYGNLTKDKVNKIINNLKGESYE
jgi:NADH-quinone oxidoreductase subunit E